MFLVLHPFRVRRASPCAGDAAKAGQVKFRASGCSCMTFCQIGVSQFAQNCFQVTPERTSWLPRFPRDLFVKKHYADGLTDSSGWNLEVLEIRF